MLDLSIVIVNYCTPEMTIECLSSLVPEISDISAKVVVVDNNSTDNSVYLLTKWCADQNMESSVEIVSSGTNSGFSNGNNIGINQFDAQYYLLLNSDTLVKKGSINALLDRAKSKTDIGLVTPRLEGRDGEAQISCFQDISPVSELVSAAETGPVSSVFHNCVVPLPVLNTISFPMWSSFACVLIKDKVFKDIGLLDDGFFMYFEDAEFCHRARKNGWEIINDPSSHVLHLGGMSSEFKNDSDLKKRLPRYYYEARARYFYLLYGHKGLVVANLFWWLGRCISKMRYILGNKTKTAVHMQWIDIWVNSSCPLAPYTHPDNS